MKSNGGAATKKFHHIKTSSIKIQLFILSRKMYIFFIMFVCSQAQNINVFFERLEHLKECAKYTNDDNVPDFCFNVAKYGLRRSRRSSNHIFSKSKVHQNAKCGLPCQKTRLYTKPEVKCELSDRVSKFWFRNWRYYSTAGCRTSWMGVWSNEMNFSTLENAQDHVKVQVHRGMVLTKNLMI